MKKILSALFFIVFLFLPVTALASESVKSFDAEYNLDRSGIIEVTEKIRYNFGSSYRYGIYRYIPYKYTYENGENAYINISGISVKDELGSTYQYEKSVSNGNIVLKIGDPDRTITGEHTYLISYKVKGGLRYLEEGDEFYWNVNGFGWDVPFDSVTAKVVLPSNLDSGDIKIACWVGTYGSNDNCNVNDLNDNVAIFSDSKLRAGENLSIAVQVPAGTFEVVDAGFMGSGLSKNTIAVLALISLSIVLLTFVIMLRQWWRKGRDPKGRGTIVPEFYPPKNITPIEAGTLLDFRVDNKDISAEIIYLAIKGYLKIAKKDKKFFGGKDFELIKLKDYHDIKNVFDTTLLSGIFGDGKERVSISELKNDFYKHMPSIKLNVQSSLIEKNYFFEKANKVRGKYIGIAFGLLIIGSILSSITGALFTMPIVSFIFLPSFVISALIVGIFGLFMPARTKEGVAIKERLLGLKKYMSVAEAERLKFFNAPEKTPEMFEELLPYAMVMGVEKEWAKQFEGVYQGQPSWYDDPTGGRFAPVIFIGDMRDFSNSVVSNMAKSPSSSGSGFSGGGFSGGGFGGGGGGSW